MDLVDLEKRLELMTVVEFQPFLSCAIATLSRVAAILSCVAATLSRVAATLSRVNATTLEKKHSLYRLLCLDLGATDASSLLLNNPTNC